MSTYPLYEDLFVKGPCLGKGGYGEVCKAVTKPAFTLLPEGTTVAVKLIKINLLNPKQVNDLKREVDILSVVSSYQGNACHENIVCYYGSLQIEKDGENYFAIVMEFIDGYKLRDFIQSLLKAYIDPKTGDRLVSYDLTTAMTNEQIAGLMKQLLLTLDYMHSLNIVHRDIKADNIMYVPSKMIVKYIDFGFSCFATLENVENKCLFNTVGTPDNIAPELWETYFETVPTSRELQTTKQIEMLKKSDVWALGVVFYELLYGLGPYDQFITAEEVASSIYDLTQAVEFEEEFQGDEYIEKLVKRMLIKRYKLRPSAKAAYDYLTLKYPD